ncbi:MAG: GspE/PulE family protein [Tissierellia bacterium]|nr:GspE/PulE family protein [Tissierellia bacterium]
MLNKELELIEEFNVVDFLDLIINEAINFQASDIHIEPDEDYTRIRYRIDGDLINIYRISKSRHSELITRIKILSNLNIAERRLPQDGRIGWSDDEKTDLRIAICPVVCGEKVVIRILNTSRYNISLDEFGFPKENYDKLKNMISRSSGMLISSGPTGCGKSTTLYALIRELNVENRNIITIEDPVEFRIRGINQIQVNDKSGMSFSTGLRSILRADPDIIMVGEIRDSETAQIAIRAAITGHLILSSLHTYDSYSAIIRLMDMGIEPYLIASALAGVQSQRLVKKLCPECSRPYQPDMRIRSIIQSVLGDNVELNLKKPIGCEKCFEGFKGRQVISEVFTVDEDMVSAIKRKADISELRNIGKDNCVKSILHDGLNRACRGEVYIEDVLRESIGDWNGKYI